MVKKPGRMYRKVEGQAYTRREYMGGVPQNRISLFTAGDQNYEYPVQLCLKVDEACQIRHISLESARVAATRMLEKKAGSGYFMRVLVYPHNVLREHKQATGAGADRISSGMRGAFGKDVGTAARVKIGQAIIRIETTKELYPVARSALRAAGMKLPSPTRIEVERGRELVG